MSELISGKDALIALANGDEVECCVTKRDSGLSEYWFSAKTLTVDEIEGEETEGNPEGEGIYAIQFRLKPRTIILNGIEVPAPFEPKDGDTCFILDTEQDEGFYRFTFSENSGIHKNYVYLGAWRTEEEIKQVVAALRSIFKPQ